MLSKKVFLKIFIFSLLCIGIGGYTFGKGDHVSQFPSVLHFFEPQLYQRDFINQAIFPPYLKVALHTILFWCANSLKLPVKYIYLFVYFIVIYAFFLANYLIICLISSKENIKELFLVFLIFISFYYPSISHFNILTDRLVPYLFVVPICLFSIYFYLTDKKFIASILISISFLIHQQIGLIIFYGISFSFLSYNIVYSKKNIKLLYDSLLWFCPFLIIFVSYFIFINVYGSHHGYPWFDVVWGDELYKMVKFRVPHHLLLSYSTLKYIIGFLFSVFIIYFSIYNVRGNSVLIKLCFISTGLIILVPAGFVFTEIIHLPVGFAMYFFRGDVFIRLIAFYCLVALLDNRLNYKAPALYIKRFYQFALIIAVILVLIPGKLKISIPGNEIVEISHCITANTPSDAFILVPPDIKGVRFYSKRSVFVSIKSHSLFFNRDRAKEWFKRVILLCGVNAQKCEGKECKKMCAENYDNMTREKFAQLSATYHIDYILVRKEKTLLDWPLICASKHFGLYEVPEDIRDKH